MLLSICDSAEILSVFRLVRIVINFIKVIVPIMLILTVMIDFLQATAASDADALKKATTLAVKKVIAAICIFFIPTFVSIVVNLSSGDDYYNSCLTNATTENISIAFAKQATKLMDIAKDKQSEVSYLNAKRAVNKISDPALKEEYNNQLKVIKTVVEAKKLLKIVKQSKDTDDYERAAEAIESIEDETIRNELNEELVKISYEMNQFMDQYSSEGGAQNPLGLPYYSQCDSRWGNIKYDLAGGCNGKSYATPCCSACGYTSFSMIAAGFNRDMTITPYTVIQYMRAPLPTYRGYGAASSGELTSSKNMQYYHLKSKVISTSKNTIMNELSLGKAVIILVPGHYIVVTPGYSSDKVVLLDPFSNWADSRKKSGETTLDSISSVYGGFSWAASYEPA